MFTKRTAKIVGEVLTALSGKNVIGGHLSDDDYWPSMRIDFDGPPDINAADFSHDVGYPADVRGHSVFVYKYDNDPRAQRE